MLMERENNDDETQVHDSLLKRLANDTNYTVKGEESALGTVKVEEFRSFNHPSEKNAPPLPPRYYSLKESEEESFAKIGQEVEEEKWGEGTERIIAICIPGHTVKVDLRDRIQKPFVAYFIQVECENGIGWTVERRFSELFALSREFAISKDVRDRPKFPSRFTRKNSFSPALLEHRRQGIEKYLNYFLHQSMGSTDTSAAKNLDLLKKVVEYFEAVKDGRSRDRTRSGSFLHRMSKEDSHQTISNDQILLQGQALMKAILQNHPNFVSPTTPAPAAKSKSTTQFDDKEKRTELLSHLSRMAALQQNQVDIFAVKILKQYANLRSVAGRDTLTSEGNNPGNVDDDEVEKIQVSSIAMNSSVNQSPGKGFQDQSRSRTYMSSLLASARLRKATAPISSSQRADFAEALVSRVHRYLAQISWKVLKSHQNFLDSNLAFGFDEDFHFDVLYRLFEVSLFKRHPNLRDLIIAACSLLQDVQSSDKTFSLKVSTLSNRYQDRGIPPSLFGACVHPSFRIGQPVKKSSGFCWGWEQSVAILNELNDHEKHSIPSEKAELVLQCVKKIQEGLSERFGGKEVPQGTEPKAIGADDFVPILFYVIACSNLENPTALLKYISMLASDALLDTSIKYWLTVFESGLYFIGALDVEGPPRPSKPVTSS